MGLNRDFLKTYLNKIQTLKETELNEEDTRGSLIDPILKALEWNIFDSNEISRNARTSSGGFIDYILKIIIIFTNFHY